MREREREREREKERKNERKRERKKERKKARQRWIQRESEWTRGTLSDEQPASTTGLLHAGQRLHGST